MGKRKQKVRWCIVDGLDWNNGNEVSDKRYHLNVGNHHEIMLMNLMVVIIMNNGTRGTRSVTSDLMAMIMAGRHI